MGKRKLPFGYKISMGEVVADSAESNLVREIFEQYVLGISYLSITAMLKKQPVPYQEGRLWNKNMVARILEDNRYVDGNGFPSIVSEEVFRRAAEKRSLKQCPIQKTDAQKLLNRLCTSTVTADTEPQVLAMLNGLIADPQRIQAPPTISTSNARTTEIERQLDSIMGQQPVDEDATARLTMQLAAARYECLDTGEYETERLRRFLSSLMPITELSAEVLRITTASVKILKGKASLTLKNGQLIEMR